MRRVAVLVCLLGCAPASGRGPARIEGGESAAPPCAPGSLVFSAPYLPTDVAFTPSGADLIVVDRGALTLRDPMTLAVRRTLLPTIDHWSRAFVSDDGAVLRAETVDGLRFAFDTKTWHATRLTDDRAVEPHEALNEDDTFGATRPFRGASDFGTRGRDIWLGLQGQLGLPPLPKEVEARAVAFAAERQRAGRTVLEAIDPFAPGDDPTIFRIVVADSAGGLHLYDDHRELASAKAPGGASVALLAISGGRILAALSTGEVAILRADLALEERVMVRPPTPASRLDGTAPHPNTKDNHGLMALALDPAGRRLAWVSTEDVFGVFDLQARRMVSELAGTGSAMVNALFLDERRVALLTLDRVMLWDTVAGGAPREHLASFQTIARTAGGLLGVGADGTGELLDPDTLVARRAICFRTAGCEDRPPSRPDWYPEAAWNRLPPRLRKQELESSKSPDERKLEAVSKEIHTAVSPDASSLLVLHAPYELGPGKTEGSLSVWDLRTLTRRQSVVLSEECFDWKVEFASPTVLNVCGTERRDAATLALLPGKPEKPDRVREGSKPDRTPVGRVAVDVWTGTNHETVFVADGKEEEQLLLAAPEIKGYAPKDNIPDQDRMQLRRRTLVVAAPGGRRFLLAGRGGVPEGGSLFPIAEAAGPLQIWCAPTAAVEPERLPVPEDPAVAEIDGLTERAVAGFPETVTAAAEAGAELFVLGADGAGPQKLVAIGADHDRVRVVPLPAGGPWKAVLPSPAGETIWLQGDGAAARLDPGGGWTIFPFAATTASKTLFFAPLSAEEAVQVASHGCTAVENAAATAEPNLRSYYDAHPAKFVKPALVEGSQIAVVVDAAGSDDRRARDELTRRAAALAALVRAPGADFESLQKRAVDDPAIRASRETKLTVVEDRIALGERPLARLFGAARGTVVGPIETKTTDPYSHRERLTTRFVRVDKLAPASKTPFSDFVKRAAANQWWPFAVPGDCLEVSLLGLAHPSRRTLIPPGSPTSFIAWRGGFAGLGNPALVFQNGAWLSAKAPLAATLGTLGAGEALAAGDRVYLRRPDGLDEIDVSTGRSTSKVALPEQSQVQLIQPGTAGEILWVTTPSDGSGALLAVGARGALTNLGPPRAPKWAGYGTPRLVPGQTARAFTTESALILRDGDRWTAIFAPAARRHGLVMRRHDLNP